MIFLNLNQNFFIPSKFKKNMAETSVNIPSGFGGLMRFNEDYSSIFSLKPSHVIIFVVLIVVFRILLDVIY
jgi:hypothetical protein